MVLTRSTLKICDFVHRRQIGPFYNNFPILQIFSISKCVIKGTTCR